MRAKRERDISGSVRKHESFSQETAPLYANMNRSLKNMNRSLKCANMNRSFKNLLSDTISLSPSSFTATAILAMPRSLAQDIVCECFKDKNDLLFVLSI